MNLEHKQREVNFYFCGGAGANIGHNAFSAGIADFAGFGDPNVVIIDSSKSNIPPMQQYSLELLEGVDGFGKDKKQAKRVIESQLPELLKRHLPSLLNVVVFSVSGATGSTVGPALIEAILKQNKAVVGICIVSKECEQTAANSLMTIGDLAKISKENSKPVVISFHDNSDNDGRLDQVNRRIITELRALLILGSGQNSGLDSADINNLFNYNNVRKIEPQLVDLLIHFTAETIETTQAIASVSLMSSMEQKLIEIEQVYSSVGYLPTEILKAVKESSQPDQYHFIVTNELMKSRMERLHKSYASFELVKKNIAEQTFQFPEDGYDL